MVSSRRAVSVFADCSVSAHTDPASHRGNAPRCEHTRIRIPPVGSSILPLATLSSRLVPQNRPFVPQKRPIAGRWTPEIRADERAKSGASSPAASWGTARSAALGRPLPVAHPERSRRSERRRGPSRSLGPADSLLHSVPHQASVPLVMELPQGGLHAAPAVPPLHRATESSAGGLSAL